MNGKVTNLTATNIADGFSAAVISQYGAHVKSGADSDVNASVNSKNGDAVAVYISEYAGYNGNVELKEVLQQMSSVKMVLRVAF